MEVVVARKMNWKSARLRSLPKQSARDEREFTDRDPATRWLERCEGHLRAQQSERAGQLGQAKRKTYRPRNGA